MDDPIAEVKQLHETVQTSEAVYEVEEGSLSTDSEDDWVAVGGIVRSPDGERIVLVRTAWSDGWVLPGGGVEERDDSLEATLRREVREETGLEVEDEVPLLVERQTLATRERSSTGWFVVFSAVATQDALTDEPGEHEVEIEAVSWFENPPDLFSGPSDVVAELVEQEIQGR